MKTFSIAAAAAGISAFATGIAHATVAGDGPTRPVVTAVPEISALEGTAAIAALAAIVLLTWERRRRAV
ncbi:hypothetical protein Q4511_13550 [Paracoccus sp. 1_MG-2023]|uniref:hypothetical protein n=1 Tax=unclassified Paracoccus (in: a-proteobacteria) TaxID=2688777 RepID=UPI001C081214|nr:MULTISPECIES: hypothetical protein [unclassified Paracoccus (in: a-proteobacteria)]MBU2958957.1 hypothetical protein [Paracoccus sp. C2R09]MDO6669952.1 hypothetical protein [Paracoccus sp. 1_MG-2023]